MKRAYLLAVLTLILSGILGMSSCKKAFNFSKDNLNFSVDTLVFDTVFTTVGSTTQNFKIYNPSKQPIQIEEVELMGGTNSPFRLNVDGEKGHFIRDLSKWRVRIVFLFLWK